jgi:hypothetical protein
MSSIYNDDMAIRNDKKGTNNMSNNSNTEQVSRTASERECDEFNAHFCERRGWSHFYAGEVTDYHQWCSEFRGCGLTRLADRVAAIRLDSPLLGFTPAEQADLELAEIALRNLSTETTGQDDEREDRASLQAAVDAVSIERDDWRNAALAMTTERDTLRLAAAAREVEVEQLREKIKELQRTALYLAHAAAYTRGMNEYKQNTDEQLAAHRRMQEEINNERQANENAIGDCINDLENGNY